MKKIAVASVEKNVCAHFGHCDTFEVFLTNGKEIVKSESLPNPGHRPGFLPNYLHEIGVDVIISGGMGQGAVEIFNEHNIEVVIGCEGPATETALAYLEGRLESGGSPCEEHGH